MHTTTGRWKLGFALTFTTTILWGLLPIVMKAALEHIDVVTMNWVRITFGFIMMSAIYGFRGGLSVKKWQQPKIAIMLIIAIVGMLGNYLTYTTGLKYVTAGASQVLIQLAGILVLLSGLTFFKERFNAVQWLGLVIFFIGMGMFFNLRLIELADGFNDYALGALWIFAASVLWTNYAVFQKILLNYLGSQEILFLIYVVGTIAFLPLAEPTALLTIGWEGWIPLAAASLITVLTFATFSESLVHWEVSKASIVASLVPINTLLFVSIINSFIPDYSPQEPMNLLSWIGIFLVVGGVGMTSFSNIGKAKKA